jgi:hypothetical protein
MSLLRIITAIGNVSIRVAAYFEILSFRCECHQLSIRSRTAGHWLCLAELPPNAWLRMVSTPAMELAMSAKLAVTQKTASRERQRGSGRFPFGLSDVPASSSPVAEIDFFERRINVPLSRPHQARPRQQSALSAAFVGSENSAGLGLW